METLDEYLFLDKVPPNWEERAYPSLLTLGAWHTDLIKRLHQLELWIVAFHVSH